MRDRTDLTKYLTTGIAGAAALIFAGAQLVHAANQPGPVVPSVTRIVALAPTTAQPDKPGSGLSVKIESALHAFSSAVRPLSNPQALQKAFGSYFAYLAQHPADVKKPLLYFVDYGLPSTEPRGYIFDMRALQIVEGPFTVAHGRGSSTTQYGIPTRFSNAPGSEATSLGLYLAEDTYAFHGKTGGHPYSSIGLRLKGLSANYNDNALARGVVAHGAPYVTATKAGRSEGCPAMEPQRAERVLPELANGGMVFLFGLDKDWMAANPLGAAAAD
ncbi:MAG: murein L,D-transpeptidase catalytic domain-containing protein [Gemmatimonadaceae bacterium]